MWEIHVCIISRRCCPYIMCVYIYIYIYKYIYTCRFWLTLSSEWSKCPKSQQIVEVSWHVNVLVCVCECVSNEWSKWPTTHRIVEVSWHVCVVVWARARPFSCMVKMAEGAVHRIVEFGCTCVCACARLYVFLCVMSACSNKSLLCIHARMHQELQAEHGYGGT